MKRILLVLGLLLGTWALLARVGAASAADTYPIMGVITLADGRAVDGAEIYVDGAPAAQSDRSGQYMAPAVWAGTHLVQPVKAGMTFVPASVVVTLPPEAAQINFTGYAANGGADSTSMLEPLPMAEQTAWQVFVDTVGRLAGVLQQMAILMLMLSAGAFLALAARSLRSGEWSLAYLFQPHTAVEEQTQAAPVAAGEEDDGWEMLEIEAPSTSVPSASAPSASAPSTSMPSASAPKAPPPIPGVEEPFEVVTAVSAPDVPRPKISFVKPSQHVEAAPGTVEIVHAAQVEDAAARTQEPEPAEEKTLPEPHGPDQHLRVRRYTGAAHAGAEPPARVEAPPADSQELLERGMKLVRRGDYAGGEALLRQVLERDQSNADAWLWLGAARLNQGERRTAERCFRQAQKLGHPQAEAALQRIK